MPEDVIRLSPPTPVSPANAGAADDLGDLEGQEPALTINCEPILVRYVEVIGRDGQVYRLRDDVPTQRLVWGFHLLDIENKVQQATGWEEREAALDEREQERLNLATTIVRHSYQQLRRADVARVFTVAQQEELCGYFFTTRLLPLLAQRLASAQQLQQEQTGQDAAQQDAAAEQTEHTEQPVTPTPPAATAKTSQPSQTSRGKRAATAGVTPSRRR